MSFKNVSNYENKSAIKANFHFVFLYRSYHSYVNR